MTPDDYEQDRRGGEAVIQWAAAVLFCGLVVVIVSAVLMNVYAKWIPADGDEAELAKMDSLGAVWEQKNERGA